MSFRPRTFVFCLNVVKLALLVLAMMAPAASSDPAPGPLLWGSLKSGPYAVGYRTLYRFDHTRQYDPEYSTDPTRPTVHSPRPILICVWYPAQASKTPLMTHGQYLEIGSDDAKFGSFAQRLKYHMREVVCEEATGKTPRGLNPVEAAAFDRFLATKTLAGKDAPPAQGRFPVLIYHPGLGGSHEDNSVLFEYLASHGYVVLSSAYQGADATNIGCGGDLTCSFRDMEFLSRFARELPYADADQLAAMGHSYGAYANLAWAAEPHSPLRAVVTLDSGVEYTTVEASGAERYIRHMKDNKENIRAAVLRFASREKEPHFEHFDPYLKYVPRYEATVAALTHNDYLTQGVIRNAFLPEKWPDPHHARRTSYDRLCVHVLHFLDATLKQQPEAQEALHRSIRGEGLDEGFKLQFKAPAPARPTHRQLTRYVRQHGAEKGAELMRSVTGRPDWNPVGVGMDLLQEGDVKTALPLLISAAKSHPKLAGLQALLGQAFTITGDRPGALAAYRKAAELLPADETVGGLRPYWKHVIQRGLEELGQPEPMPKS